MSRDRRADPSCAPAYSLPPLAWLRAFEAAARHASFTAAAAELNLTQAAVSHQVRSLEKHLGVVLFERLARTLRLTEMGNAYLPPLRRAFDDLTAATAGLFGPIGKRTLVVRAPVSFVALWLAPRLSRFSAAHPEIGLRIASAVWSYEPEETSVDVDIRFGDGVWPGHNPELVLLSPAAVVCRPDRLPPGTTAERLRMLARERLIHVTGYEDLWRRLFRAHAVDVSDSRGLDVDTSLAALEFAAAGYGATIVLDCFLQPFLDSGRLVRAVEEKLPIDAAHYIAVPDGARRQSPEAVLFKAWLKEEARAGGEDR